MAEKKTIFQEFSKGLLKENPVLRLVLGTCPTLATTTSLESAIGMGLSAAIVLVCSNIVISALRKVIPSKVRIPCYIVVIAGFVTIVQMLVKAYLPALNDMLGVYLPLIVVNCIILGRAEAFAGKNSVIRSAADGLGMGIGFTCALIIMGGVRELLGAGKLLGFQVLPESIPPMTIFVLAPGGFFVFGLVMACANRLAEKKGKPKAELHSCGSCPWRLRAVLKTAATSAKMRKRRRLNNENIFVHNFDRYSYKQLHTLQIPRYMPVSRRIQKLNTAVGMSLAVIFVMVISSAVTYPLNTFLDNHGLGYLQTIVFILVIAALVQLIEIT